MLRVVLLGSPHVHSPLNKSEDGVVVVGLLLLIFVTSKSQIFRLLTVQASVAATGIRSEKKSFPLCCDISMISSHYL